MMTRKKRILIIAIVLLLLTIVAGGVYALLFFKTDILKSNRDLFYEKIGNNSDILNIIDKEWLEKCRNKVNSAIYNESGEISLSIPKSESVSGLATAINNSKIEFEGTVDKANKKAYQNIKIIYNNEEIKNEELFNLKFLRENDLYGLKSDEVVVKYVSIENNNVHQLLNRLGISNTNNIANKIEKYDFLKLLNMSEERKSEILKRYTGVLNKEIPKNRYSREKDVSVNKNGQDYIANKYTLKLTGNEEIKVKIKLLETLLNDDDILQEINTIENKNEENLKVIKTKIQDEINDIKRQPANDKFTLEISVYVANEELIKTEIKNQTSITTIENTNTKNNQEVVIINTEVNSGTITKTYKLKRTTFTNINELSLEYDVAENNKQTMNTILNIKNEGVLTNSNTLDTLVNLKIKDTNGERELKIKSKKEFEVNNQIESLSDNTVTLNEMTLDYNKNTIQAIKERLISIYEERAENVGLNPNMITDEFKLTIKKLHENFNRDEFEKQIQRILNYIKQDEIAVPEYKKKLQAAKTDEEKRKIKQDRLFNRLIEFGIEAEKSENDEKILIDSGYNYNYEYYIDYDKYIITKKGGE